MNVYERLPRDNDSAVHVVASGRPSPPACDAWTDRLPLPQEHRNSRRQRIEARLSRRPVLVSERFPLTILVAVQYGPMLVYPAIVHRTPLEKVMIFVTAVAVSIAFISEVCMARVPPHAIQHRPGVTWRSATAVLGVGVLAQVGLVVAGNVNYAAGASGAGQSHLAAIFTPFLPWLTFGIMMFIWLWRTGDVGRGVVWAALGVAAVLQLALIFRTGATAEAASFALSVSMVAVIMRFIRIRWLLAAVILIPVLWPPLYQLRNQIRHEQVITYRAAGQPPAFQRLREDLNFAHIAQLPTVPDPSLAPGLLTELRFGLLPRVLDSGRGTLATADRINVAEGGQGTSAATLTTLGDAYAMRGWLGVPLVIVPLAVAMGWAVRRRSPWGYMLVAVLINSGAWIESTYPDLIAAILQSSISLVAMGIAVTVLRLNPRASGGGSGAAAHRLVMTGSRSAETDKPQVT